MKKHVLLLTMLFAGLALTSCGENTSSASSSSVATSSSESTSSSSISDSSSTVSVKKEIKFAVGETLSIKQGKETKLEVIIPEGYSSDDIEFSLVAVGDTDPEEILDLTFDGSIIALKEGSAIVKATLQDMECQITVTVEPIIINGISFKQGTSVQIDNGETLTLEVEVDSPDVTTIDLAWSTTQIEGYTDSYLTIDNGTITGTNVGRCNVVASTLDGLYSASIEVRVLPKVEEGSIDDFTVTVLDATALTAELTKYSGTKAAITIPTSATIDGQTYTITSIGANCFKSKTILERVHISEGITDIKANAFYGCSNLYDLTLPTTLKRTYNSCFYKCTSLESVTLPENFEYLGMNSFNSCSGLKEVKFNDTLKGGIDSSGDTLDGVLNGCFVKCTSLTSVTLPDTITSIQRVFSGCSSLNEVNLPKNLVSLLSATFQETALTKLVIPDSVETIGNLAISRNEKLEELVLPKSLKLYDNNGTTSSSDDVGLAPSAISGNPLLSKISFGSTADNFTIVDNGYLYDKNQTTLYRVFSCASEKDYVAPSTLTSIIDSAFESSDVKTVDISSVTSLGEEVFLDCKSLTSVKLSNELTILPTGAFKNCSSLTSIEFPSKLTELDNYALYNTGFTSLILPSSVTKIGSYSLASMAKLTSLTLNEGLTSVSSYSFEKDSLIESITIPTTLTKIPELCFNGWTSLKTITLQEGLTSVGYGAFKNCSSLESISFPSTITTLNVTSSSKNYMFEGCTSLKSISVPDTVTKYKTVDGVLYQVSTSNASYYSLLAYPMAKEDETFNIPDTTYSVAAYAFSGATNLKKVSLPEHISTVSSYAFNNCTNLQEVLFNKFVTDTTIQKATKLTISSNSFAGCTNISKVYYTGTKEEWGNKNNISCSDTTIKGFYNSYDSSASSNVFTFEYASKTL